MEQALTIRANPITNASVRLVVVVITTNFRDHCPPAATREANAPFWAWNYRKPREDGPETTTTTKPPAMTTVA
jgi:hypothetical protein